MIPLHVLILHIYLAGIRAYAWGRRHEGTDTNIAVADPQLELQTITGARCPQAFKAKSNGLCPIVKYGIAKIIKPIITSNAKAGAMIYLLRPPILRNSTNHYECDYHPHNSEDSNPYLAAVNG